MKPNDVSIICNNVIKEVEKAIVGKSDLLRKIMTSVLADGHILIEDYPGLAKTLIANSFATVLGLDFKRIQFTPDLLPGDITGGYIFDRSANQFEFRKGPIFSNIILADEINRASPKTQSALLEAMQERQVSIEGKTMKLPDPFIVIATQNPIESEGTFPLPEAQLDRFLVKFSVGYPTPDEEFEILNRRKDRKQDHITLNSLTDQTQILQMRQSIEDVYIEPDIKRYIVALINETRNSSRIMVGASPRAGLALLKLVMAWATINNRNYVLPDDIKYFMGNVLAHRMILIPDLWMNSDASGEIIKDILNTVPVPVIEEMEDA